MDLATIWLGPEVETVEAVNYFGMDMGKLAVRKRGAGSFCAAAVAHRAWRIQL